MTTLVSGASGNLGRLILDELVDRGVPTDDLVAGMRTPRGADHYRARGIDVVHIDYDNPDTLRPAMQGVDRFVLVSVSQPTTPLTQHHAVVEAAAAAGVSAIAYTSVYRASESSLPLAPVHAAAEAAIRESAVPAVILRNNCYTELFRAAVHQASRGGFITAAVGDARIAGATRADYAAAAAIAIGDDAYLGRVLELSGDEPFGYADIAAAATEILGRDIEYRALSTTELIADLAASGLDEASARFMASLDSAIASGEVDSTDRTLSQIIGRPTTPLIAGLRGTR